MESIQIVDEDQNYNDSLLKYVKDISKSNIGLDYHIVSVFGSQSTGKSTLLNALFGTKFDVMEESRRQQTTKGIWLAYASKVASSASSASPNPHNILVMDVEGTDGRERGEDQDFERKAALFALSTSEVLIVNIWEHQVGLYQGANMGLLKTVFEVNLSLFSKTIPQKCLLLFVIRDHVGTTSLESLSELLTEDLNKLWSQLNKPPNLKDVKISNYFDLAFASLPHKILKEDEFYHEIDVLGDKFNNDNFYFKKSYHKNIPLDGWTVYSENIWHQIVENKELDLPTQQILVARFRCDEIIQQAYDEFSVEFEKCFPQDGKNVQVLKDIESVFKDLKTNPLEVYDSLASRYTRTVYVERRKQLIEKIDKQLASVYKSHLSNLKSECVQLFNDKLTQLSKSDDFVKSINLVFNECMRYFDENTIKDEAFSSAIEREELESTLSNLVKSQKIKEVKSLINKFTKKFNSQLKEKLIFLLRNPNNTTWDDAQSTFNTLLDKMMEPYKSEGIVDFRLGLSRAENEQVSNKLHRKAWTCFHTIVHDYLDEDNVVKILRNAFEDKFRYDEEGLPMVWKNATEIDLQYKSARASALKLLPILTVAKTSEGIEIIPSLPANEINTLELGDEEEEELEENADFAHIISDMEQSLVSEKFKKQIDVLYIEAKRSTIQSISSIPYWIYIIIIILGWNEFMAVIRNPLYFTFLAIMVVGGYFVHQMNLWGPLQIVVGNTVNETIKMGKLKLKEILVEEEPEKVESVPMEDL